MSLPLDHVSLAVGSLAEAISVLDRQLGLSVTVTPEDPERHGRIFLDQAYLEVSEGNVGAGWTAPLFFLGFSDPDDLRIQLDSSGIEYRWGEYVGVDGTWDDVEIVSGDVPLPILVRRTEPPEVATDWPPALTKPHRSGAQTLAAVHVTVPSLGTAECIYEKLGELMPGQIVLREGEEVGVSGVVLGCTSLETTRSVLGMMLGEPDEAGVSWVQLSDIMEFRIGFAVTRPQ